MNAHTPYILKRKHAQALNIEETHLISNPNNLSQTKRRIPSLVVDSYDVAVRGVDEQVGKLLKSVDEDTIVVITADHGEEFGLHNSFHEASLYQNMTKIPLLIKDPRLNGEKKTSLAQHIDIPLTLHLSAKLSKTKKEWEGRDLKNIDDSQESVYLGISKGGKDVIGVINPPWKLIWNKTENSYELYNIEKDPRETSNIISKKPKRFERLRSDLESHYSRLKKKRINTGKPPYGRKMQKKGKEKMEETVKRRLRELGYL